MRIGRKAIVSAVIAATAAGTMMFAAPKAMATPSNCTISYPAANYTASAVCTSGTGYYEVDVVMSQGAGGQINAVQGNCAAIGQVSGVNASWPVILNVFVFKSNSSDCS